MPGSAARRYRPPRCRRRSGPAPRRSITTGPTRVRGAVARSLSRAMREPSVTVSSMRRSAMRRAAAWRKCSASSPPCRASSVISSSRWVAIDAPVSPRLFRSSSSMVVTNSSAADRRTSLAASLAASSRMRSAASRAAASAPSIEVSDASASSTSGRSCGSGKDHGGLLTRLAMVVAVVQHLRQPLEVGARDRHLGRPATRLAIGLVVVEDLDLVGLALDLAHVLDLVADQVDLHAAADAAAARSSRATAGWRWRASVRRWSMLRPAGSGCGGSGPPEVDRHDLLPALAAAAAIHAEVVRRPWRHRPARRARSR